MVLQVGHWVNLTNELLLVSSAQPSMVEHHTRRYESDLREQCQSPFQLEHESPSQSTRASIFSSLNATEISHSEFLRGAVKIRITTQ